MYKYISVLVAIAIFGGWYWQNSLLEKSKTEGAKIVSRAVITNSSSTFSENNVTSNSNSVANSLGSVSEKPKAEIIKKSGKFVSLDPVHYAKGVVELVVTNDIATVNFGSDFATNPDGPDLYVWLVKKQEIKNIALGGVSKNPSDYIDLGALSKTSGAQSYQISKAELGNKDYAVVIWCRAFGIQFSNAILQ